MRPGKAHQMDGHDAGAPSGRIAARTVATLALAMLLGSLGTSIANIALPTLAEAFAAPFAAVQAVVVAYLAALTIAVVIAGRLGDRYGLKPMLVAGLSLFALASLFCALAPSLPLLIAARALQGSGAAFLMTLSMALMRQTASPARIGRVMACSAPSRRWDGARPVLGGLLIPLAGWRGIFAVLVPLALLALILATAMPQGAAVRERRASSRPGVAVIRGLVPNLLVNLLVAAVMMTTLVVGPFYLGIALGLTATQVGLVMAVGPAISVISGVPSGRLVDAGGPRLVGTVGLGLLAGGAFLLALLPNLVGVTGYMLAMAVVTPGYQLFQAANNTAALADVPPDRRGTVAGLLNLSRNIGLIAGASVMGAVFAFGVGTGRLRAGDAHGHRHRDAAHLPAAGALMLVAIGLVAAHVAVPPTGAEHPAAAGPAPCAPHPAHYLAAVIRREAPRRADEDYLVRPRRLSSGICRHGGAGRPLPVRNPTFTGTVDEASEGVSHILLTHGHGDHVGDTVAIAKATARRWWPMPISAAGSARRVSTSSR